MNERQPGPFTMPMMQVRTKAEAVYQELSAHILDGRMEPGSTVNQEGLAASLGVSITPLRAVPSVAAMRNENAVRAASSMSRE